MTPTNLLRAASILTAIHAVLHTVGGMFGSPRNIAQSAARLSAQSLRFEAFGMMRSYWDFYFGFGLVTSLMLVLLTALLWQLSSLINTDLKTAKPLLAMVFATFVVLSVISLIYFFMPPFLFEIVIAFCIGLAYAKAAKKSTTGKA